jgi:hypothetical protein
VFSNEKRSSGLGSNCGFSDFRDALCEYSLGSGHHLLILEKLKVDLRQIRRGNPLTNGGMPMIIQMIRLMVGLTLKLTLQAEGMAILTTHSAFLGWQTSLPQSGNYEVFVWLPDPDPFDPNLKKNDPPDVYLPTKMAKYKIYHKTGVATINVDQGVNKGGFTSLGVFDFDTTAKIELSNNDEEYWRCIAFDAIKFVPVTQNKPDLIVEDILVDPDPPSPGERTEVWFKIKKKGTADAIGIFYLDVYFDGTYIGNDGKNGLSAGSDYTVSWFWNPWPSDTNPHTVRGVVDLRDDISESNESNNERLESFSAMDVPDIRTPISSIGFGDVTVGSLDKTTTIYNDGTATLTINSITRSSGSSDFTYIGPSTPFTTGVGGSRTITVRFAPTSTILKSATFNVNSNDPDEANVPFSVSGSGKEDFHDMAVTNVYTTPSSPNVGESTTIYVTVKNEGTQQESSVPVKAYVDGVQKGSTQYVTLSTGQTTTKSFPWIPDTDKTYSVKGEVGTVSGETDTGDNSITINVPVSQPPRHDMAVTDVYSSPSSPQVGQSTTIYVTVKNEGTQQETSVPVKAYVDGVQKGSTQYVTLSAGQTTTKSFPWTPDTAKTYSVKGEVGTVSGETDTGDNRETINVVVNPLDQDVTLTLYVHAGSETGPFLSGVRVTGNDAGGTSFDKTTGTGGYVTITGASGLWHFKIEKLGYKPVEWDLDIATTCERDAFFSEMGLVAPVPQSPGEPIGSQHTPIAYDSITFTWTKNNVGATYRLYVRDITGQGDDAPSIGAPLINLSVGDVASYTWYGAQPNKKYRWGVQAEKSGYEPGYDEMKRLVFVTISTKPTKLQKVIQQEAKETRVITVDGEEYYIVTLKRHIDPETWEPSDYSFFAEEPPAWIVYTYPNYQPISDKEDEELKELFRDIWTVNRANTLVKRVGSPEGISDTIQVIDEVIAASQGLSDADYLAVWCKTGIFETLDLVFFAELNAPIADLGLGTIVEEQLGDYTDPARFEKEAGRACLEASKANYSQAREIAEAHRDGFSDYTTAYEYLNYYYNGHIKQLYGVGLALPTGEISESAWRVLADWVPEYIDHLALKITSIVNKFFIIGERTVEIATVAKDELATMEEARDYNNKMKEIEQETIQLIEHETFPVDYTLALLNQDSDPLYEKWGIHGIDHINYNLCSPGELRVNDSQGRVTGLVNGEVKMEIPNSYYFYSSRTVTIFFQNDSYAAEVVGTGEGTYGLEITSVEDGKATTFTATAIPTSLDATHQYTLDWDALSQGEEGVTVKVDSDGDSVFEQTITADNELTQEEFLSATNVPQVPILTPIGLIALLCLLTLIATSTILRQKRR